MKLYLSSNDLGYHKFFGLSKSLLIWSCDFIGEGKSQIYKRLPTIKLDEFIADRNRKSET